MALHITNPETEQAVRRLAGLRGTSIAETVRQAVEAELLRENSGRPAMERLKPLLDDLRAIAGPNRRPVDKAFFDDLWAEPDVR